MNEGAVGLPYLASLRVVVGGGPYAAGDIVSIAFNDPIIGRLASVQVGREQPRVAAALQVPNLPHVISGRLLSAVGPYEADDILVLSFIDPSLARLFPIIPPENGECHPQVAVQEAAGPVAASPLEFATAEPKFTPESPSVARGTSKNAAPLLLLHWSLDDARRFISVVDKLFTVDRLGWYRHALAMRLLLASEIVISDQAAIAEINRRLDDLRSAATDALNAPLLSAFMPHFSIDVAWLESIEPPSLTDAVARLRQSLGPHVAAAPILHETGVEAMLSGAILFEEWSAVHPTNIDAFIPLLIPHHAADPAVTQRVGEYRCTLLDLFGQMAHASAAVRFKQMTSANHLLDERLWNLAGAFQDAYG